MTLSEEALAAPSIVVFVDTETTGLDPDFHEIWEIGLIVDNDEYVWQLPVDLGRADPVALNVGRYHERRRRPSSLDDPEYFAEEFAELTRGRHLAGAVISFDAERLWKLLKANGACPEWHYHLVDVEALAAGRAVLRPPWDSTELSRAVGVDPGDFDRHTAIGDARWARALYQAVMGWPTPGGNR